MKESFQTMLQNRKLSDLERINYLYQHNIA